MRTYLRNRTVGGTYFFTVNLAERHGNRLLLEHVEVLRAAFRRTCLERPFTTIAWVVLPEHLHCLWRLPAGDDDYATRWRLIKSRFSRAIPRTERRSASRIAKAERGVWQRRYWEHLVRDDADLRAHVDYIHINSVNMATLCACGIGRIHRSIATWNADGLLKIGRAIRSAWSLGRGDGQDCGSTPALPVATNRENLNEA